MHLRGGELNYKNFSKTFHKYWNVWKIEWKFFINSLINGIQNNTVRISMSKN